jgi:hypothetical protein
MKPALTVMAGLVPAIYSGTVPRLMAGTSPAMTMKATPKANRVSCQERSDPRAKPALDPGAGAAIFIRVHTLMGIASLRSQ